MDHKDWSIGCSTEQLAVVVEALQEVSEDSHDDYGQQANALLCQLEKFGTFFGLNLAFLVFSGTIQTSINL